MKPLEVHVLVVEDDLAMRELLVKVLQSKRFAAVGASGGLEAMELLARGGFHLMLSDIRMSPMDGLALTSRAKALAPQTKVLLMTAYGEHGDARRARAAGADGCMSKPFSMRELLAAVRTLVGEDRRTKGKRLGGDRDSPVGRKEKDPCFDL